MGFLQDWSMAQLDVCARAGSALSFLVRWTRPPEGYVKCNINAEVFVNQGVVGSGVLV